MSFFQKFEKIHLFFAIFRVSRMKRQLKKSSKSIKIGKIGLNKFPVLRHFTWEKHTVADIAFWQNWNL